MEHSSSFIWKLGKTKQKTWAIFFSVVVHTPAGFSRTESPPPWALPCTYLVPELAMSNLFEACWHILNHSLWKRNTLICTRTSWKKCEQWTRQITHMFYLAWIHMYMALASLVIEYYFFFVVNFNKEGPHTVSIRSQKDDDCLCGQEMLQP
jgi:hypothetical protein